MSMSKRCSFCLIVLVLIFPAALSAQSIHIPPHEKVIFKNGLTVLLLEKHGVPIVNFAALVKTGAAADPQGQEGPGIDNRSITQERHAKAHRAAIRRRH